MTTDTTNDPALAQETTDYCNKLAKAGTEHAEQRALFGWAGRMVYLGRVPDLDLMFAVPNGGKRDQITAARLKAEGVKPGVPDVSWPVPMHGWHGLYLEMKKNKTGRVSEVQTEYHNRLRSHGYAVAVCWDWQQARDAIMDYCSGKPMPLDYGKRS